ncbi:MAG TPA: NADH-quinone oxidoreductase subunit NuoG [Acidimicrobiales bacterium]|nr:NADH-quinone oxidoreductase subunit NuoG [Acidimicrobiales bacterium]
MVEIVLDGRPVQAAEGELIIAAAERAGVYIPRFCYHPRMKPVGMCRMCLVEVSGPRGASLQPACFLSVADGQEISTTSPAARKAQEGVLEFLLVNHPLDCPVCDKGGECPLQDQAVSYGPGESRFIEEKRHWAKPIALGPLTLLDRERCIQCARCTRFAEEIAGEPLIDFYERGERIEVAVFPERPFTSYFSGNTVQICPVGALTSVPYRFKSRPWDLEQVESTCTYCAVGCRLAAQSSAGSLVRYLGIDSEPVNQSWLCDRGRYGYEATSSPARLTTPLLRRDGELVPVGWNEALRVVADHLGKVPGETVGIIGGARLANEDAYAWSKLARSVIGTDNLDAQLGDGLPAELVCSLPRATIEDTCSAKAVVVLAGDLREDLPVLFLRLRAAADQAGLQVIDCSPVPTSLAAVAATSLVYRPGESVSLARGLVGAGAEVPAVSPARLAKARDVLSGALESAPDGSGIVIVLGRPSLTESPAQLAAAAEVLADAWPAARFLPALRRANVLGALDMGCAPGILPGRVSRAEGDGWYRASWGSLPEHEGLDTAAMLEAATNADIGTLLLLGSDPLSDFPDRRLATKALEAVPFLVAVDALPSPSTMLADVVLPVATSIERAGSTTNIEGRVTRLNQKLVPPGQARPDWIVAVELARLLGGELGFESVDEIWEEIEALVPSHRGCTLAVLLAPSADDGIVLPLPPTAVTPRSPERIDPMATPGITSVEEQGAPLYTGAVLEPGTPEAPRSSSHSGSDSPPSRPGLMTLQAAHFPAPTSPPLDGYAFRLVTRRSLYDQGTLLQASPSLASLVPSQALRLRPKEMEQLGVHEGEDVRVRSLTGELIVPVVADDSLPGGVAVLPFGVVPVDQPSVADLLDCAAIVSHVRVETLA